MIIAIGGSVAAQSKLRQPSCKPIAVHRLTSVGNFSMMSLLRVNKTCMNITEIRSRLITTFQSRLKSRVSCIMIHKTRQTYTSWLYSRYKNKHKLVFIHDTTDWMKDNQWKSNIQDETHSRRQRKPGRLLGEPMEQRSDQPLPWTTNLR